ncbi:hypothetical protein GOBAR_AA16262 [Gossypium barbadense]|uniref:Uncharacterized protein n=1 Tax=Gossypium barbadense TaxID=3634 RepID=A0A2P5XM62_GOSBA|nr:hypothetical protein GOBAR_AA16262 [Gossypium barbadense]
MYSFMPEQVLRRSQPLILWVGRRGCYGRLLTGLIRSLFGGPMSYSTHANAPMGYLHAFHMIRGNDALKTVINQLCATKTARSLIIANLTQATVDVLSSQAQQPNGSDELSLFSSTHCAIGPPMRPRRLLRTKSLRPLAHHFLNKSTRLTYALYSPTLTNSHTLPPTPFFTRNPPLNQPPSADSRCSASRSPYLSVSLFRPLQPSVSRKAKFSNPFRPGRERV